MSYFKRSLCLGVLCGPVEGFYVNSGLYPDYITKVGMEEMRCGGYNQWGASLIFYPEWRKERRGWALDEKSQQQPHGPHHLILSKRATQTKIQTEDFRTGGRIEEGREKKWLVGLWCCNRANHLFTVPGRLLALHSSLLLFLNSMAPASTSRFR